MLADVLAGLGAVLWLFALLVGLGCALAITLPNGAPDWTAVPLSCGVMAVWFLIVRWRVHFAFALAILLAALLYGIIGAVPMGAVPGLFFCIAVPLIGLAKFVVWSSGRRSVFARSGWASAKRLNPPKGLVGLQDDRGLTLLAVVVAAAIVAIALAAAASGFIGASRLTKQAADFTIASNFAEGVMEEVRSRPYGRIVSGGVHEGLPKLPGVTCAVQAEPQGDALKEVTITCSWRELGRSRAVRFATLVARGGAR